jgi:wyosine [tRNA(Phe)-imidazoG37] synthetase (radical SAM superfamily)
MPIVYGPVPSWRLGKSLGVDLVSTFGKTCSFDCVYCQLGKTTHPLTEREEFISLRKLAEELPQVKGVAIDYVTFSGVGEPTLASNLGKAISLVKDALNLPVAVLTNSSLMPRDDVRRELALADVVVAKMDAPTEEVFQKVNLPFTKYTFEEIIRGVKLFRAGFSGKLALQMMFIEANREYASEMSKIAQQLSPDEVQLNTPLRPCAVRPLPPEDISAIRQAFSGFKNVVTVYQASKPEVRPLNLEETRRRRPAEGR